MSSAVKRNRSSDDQGTPRSPKGSRSSAKAQPAKESVSENKIKNDAPAAAAKSDPTHSKLLHTLIVRSITGIIMMVCFCLLMWTGHAVITGFVVVLQVLVYREMTALRYREAKERDIPLFRSLNWYFLASTLYWLYGRRVWVVCKDLVPSGAYEWLYHHHMWHSFVLYILGFLGFVMTLRGQSLKYQFGQLTWILMTLLTVVIQAQVITVNIYNGLFWFMLPHSLIICNDIMAYFVGISIGKKFIQRPLTPLSPNKTWEGFIGSAIFTIIFSVAAAGFLGQFDWFRCTASQLAEASTCPVLPVFATHPLQSYLPATVVLPSIIGNIPFSPIQGHAIIFALFASVIAPFGGFFASAIKRAYEKKDFDQVLPGHGGVTDRMDCQFLIGLFIYTYYITFIQSSVPDVDTIIAMLAALPVVDQQEVLRYLQNALPNQTVGA